MFRWFRTGKEEKKKIPFEELDYENIIMVPIDYSSYTDEQIDKIKSAAYRRNMVDGKYKRHSIKGYGPDNPSIVGQEEFANVLYYNRETDAWLLTDGLGNGIVR